MDDVEMETACNSQECGKYKKLLQCVDKFVESTRDRPGTCKKLSKSFLKSYKDYPDAVQTISDQIWDRFESNLKADAISLVDELNFRSLLNHVDDQSVNPDPAWRASGIPDKDLEPFLAKVKHEEIKKLSAMLQSCNAEADMLKEELAKREEAIKKLLANVEEEVDRWEQTSTECNCRADDISKAYDIIRTSPL